jgi:TonB family protein
MRSRLGQVVVGFAMLGFARPTPGAESPTAFSEGMTRPRPVQAIDWSVPDDALRRGISGLIVLKCVIAVDGLVRDCEVIKSVPGLTEWAIGKLERARFVPATLNGKPVQISYVFNINVAVPGSPRPPETPRFWRPLIDSETSAECRKNAELCTTAALGLIDGDAGRQSPDRAGRLLGAACESGVKKACQFLDDWYQAPHLLDGLDPPRVDRRGAEGEVVCWISAAGRAHDCRGGAMPYDRWFAEQLPAARFLPAKFKGEPFETEHAIRYSVHPR